LDKCLNYSFIMYRLHMIIDFIFEIASPIVSAFIAGYFLDALKKPFPVTRIDYWVRKNFKKSKINGQNLEVFLKIELDTNDQDYLEKPSLEQLSKLIQKINLNGIGIEYMGKKDEEQINGNINIGEHKGKFEITSKTEDSDDPGPTIETPESYVTVKILFDHWNYRHVDRLINDSKTVIDHFILLMKDTYKFSMNGLSVTFKTNKQPLILSYLSKVSKNTSSYNIDLEKNLHASFSGNMSRFVNVNTTQDIQKVIEAMVWYV